MYVTLLPLLFALALPVAPATRATAPAGPVPVMPSLHIAADGSARGLVTLERDQIIELRTDSTSELSSRGFSDDANIRSTADSAALVIQQRHAPDTLMAFVSTLQCHHGQPREELCTRDEDHIYRGFQLAEHQDLDPIDNPRLRIPAGEYWVAILAESGARTTATISFDDDDQPDQEPTHTARYAAADLATALEPHFELTLPTDAALRAKSGNELTWTREEGQFEATMSAPGLVTVWAYTSSLRGNTEPWSFEFNYCLSGQAVQPFCGWRKMTHESALPVSSGGGTHRDRRVHRAVDAGSVLVDWSISCPGDVTAYRALLLTWPDVLD